MVLSAIGNFRDLIELFVSSVSVLGGAMAFFSGLAALRATQAGEEPWQVANQINEGLALGFSIGWSAGSLVFIILATT